MLIMTVIELLVTNQESRTLNVSHIKLLIVYIILPKVLISSLHKLTLVCITIIKETYQLYICLYNAVQFQHTYHTILSCGVLFRLMKGP